jgi:hypothetical protein
MVQEVRIPVKADVGQGVAGVGKVEDLRRHPVLSVRHLKRYLWPSSTIR